MQHHCIFVKLYKALADLFTTGATAQNMVKTDDASVKTEQNKTTQHNTTQNRSVSVSPIFYAPSWVGPFAPLFWGPTHGSLLT
jgi:hypothetical protein